MLLPDSYFLLYLFAVGLLSTEGEQVGNSNMHEANKKVVNKTRGQVRIFVLLTVVFSFKIKLFQMTNIRWCFWLFYALETVCSCMPSPIRWSSHCGKTGRPVMKTEE
ncbi:MAG: hypothetical protein WDM78_19890 [Puia sp.]